MIELDIGQTHKLVSVAFLKCVYSMHVCLFACCAVPRVCAHPLGPCATCVVWACRTTLLLSSHRIATHRPVHS